jgi:hypothetical protein
MNNIRADGCGLKAEGNYEDKRGKPFPSTLYLRPSELAMPHASYRTASRTPHAAHFVPRAAHRTLIMNSDGDKY